MSMESKALKEIEDIKSENEYLKKTNRCIAKEVADGNCDFVWVMRNELKVLDKINGAGGLKQFEIKLIKSLIQEFADGCITCEDVLLNRLNKMEADNE